MRYFPLLLLLLACQPPLAQTTAPATRRVPDAPLRNTRWVPREIAGQPVVTPADAREPNILFENESRVRGNLGCNTFGAEAAETAQQGLRLAALRSTKMACSALATETRFAHALELTRRYQISGDTLRLLGAEAAVLARLEAVYLR